MWSAYLSCVCMCENCTLFTPLFDVTCLQTRAKNVKFHFKLKNAVPSKRNGAWRSKLRRCPRTPNDSIFQKLPPRTWSVELGSSHGSRHNCRRSPRPLVHHDQVGASDSGSLPHGNPAAIPRSRRLDPSR